MLPFHLAPYHKRAQWHIVATIHVFVHFNLVSLYACQQIRNGLKVPLSLLRMAADVIFLVGCLQIYGTVPHYTSNEGKE